MTKRIVLLAVFVMQMAFLRAQTQADWTVDVGSFVSNAIFIKQSSVGTLVVSTPTKLIGINPHTKQKSWEVTEIRDIQDEEYKNIEGTQYFMVEFQKQTALTKNKTVAIFDSYSGQMVYNSRDEDIKVRNTRIIKELKGMMIEAVKGDKYFIGFLDFETSKIAWTKEFGKVKTGGIGIGALKRAIKSYTQSIFNTNPVVDANGNFIMAHKETVYSINGKTGAETWTREFKDDVTDFLLSKDKKEIYIIYDDLMDKANAATGKTNLDKPLKVDGKVNGLMPLNDAYVLMHSDGFNIIEVDGKFRWKKDASVGNIAAVWPVSDGFIALESNEKDGKIFKVSNEGKKLWSESLSDPVYAVEPLDKGVLYITTSKANILSYEKGKDVWKKDVKIKGSPAFGTDYANKKIYVFSNKTLSAFNLTEGEYRIVAEDVKLKDYDDEKEMAIVEKRDGGIYLQTNQNVALIKEDGTVVYNKNYKEAGMGKGLRAAMGILGTATQVAGVATAVKGLSKPNEWESVKQVGPNTYEVESKRIRAGGAMVDGGGALQDFAMARYYATQSAKNTVYILTKWDGDNGLAVIQKDDGNELKKIAFNDKTPQYVVDEADYMLYIIVGGKELRAYDLKK